MNRQLRRAMAKVQRHQEAERKRLLKKPAPTVHMPGWAQAEESKLDQALKEAVALQSLLAHTGTDDEMGHWSSLMEIVLRICHALKKRPTQYLDPEAVHEAHKCFMRSAWALHKAAQRHKDSGVYGFDAGDRAALIEAEEYVAAFRQSVPRLVWARAIREALTAPHGITLKPLEELEAA